ncbi:hypothetical protein QBC46DRAFT_414061 [Diplogelasinospora grovesii]|uniref:SET domain-containing protein n=1 Tax=Diplogelasinospora grovesii TaxID=303347 RepID=A0AAN6RZ89_9PEZI|nr:hypothetical protein QBC46DRAFT_414061 [Diplogelasinospora grovesii]
MARIWTTRALLLCSLLLLTWGVIASDDDRAEGLAYEAIQKVEVYTDNATSSTTGQSSGVVVVPEKGWYIPKICSGGYCVFANRGLVNGRGLALVTKFEDFQKVERVEDHLNRGANKYDQKPGEGWEEADVVEKGPGIVALKPLRRGKPLMAWTPVLMVHKDLFRDVTHKAERTRLLEKAVSFLPDQTRERFNKQRGGKEHTEVDDPWRSVEDVVLAHPFEIDLGFAVKPDDHAKHYVNYPEVSVLQHDCRPNVAFYIDNNLAHRTTIARKVQPGEELTIAYVDPMLARGERNEWIKKHRGLRPGNKENKKCPCLACNQKGNLAELKKSDARIEELLAIQAELKNHDSTKVTPEMIARYVELHELERLNTKLADAYELVALNYNYLGDHKNAKKYADLAVQAGIVEGGVESNDVVAMRIMASDVKGHYSYEFTVKKNKKSKSSRS